MDIVKKNLLSIICGVLALIAVVLWFWPLDPWKSEAQAKLKERTALNTSMQSLLPEKATRKLPVVSLDGSGSRPLGVFPTQKVIDWAGALKDKLKAEAEQARKAASGMSARPVLLEGVLPVAEPTKDYEFRERYLQAVAALPAQMRMGPPPSPKDIERAADTLWQTQYETHVQKRDGVPDPASQQEQQEAFDKESKLIPERVRQQRARSLICYLGEDVIVPEKEIGDVSSGTAPTPKAMWYAQMHYWVQGDMLKAIAEANRLASKQKCVIDAPVKYIREMTIGEYRADLKKEGSGPGPMAGAGGPGGPPAGMTFGPPPEVMEQIRKQMAAAGASPMDGAAGGGAGGGNAALRVRGAGKLTGESPTGRKSNALYDVIPVELVMDVEADRLPYVLAQLGRNTFITPYEVSISSVDSVVLGIQENVVYGPAPVVRATVYCELLMFRDWTTPLMPAPVKKALGIGGGGEAAQSGM